MTDVVGLIERIEADLKRLKTLVTDDPRVRYTGCRWTRGQGGIGHAHDVLGTDLPPAGWQHPRPTAAEIAAALAQREHAA